jgi:hypothetical protein
VLGEDAEEGVVARRKRERALSGIELRHVDMESLVV